jgi:hypothetical protein
MRSMTAILGIAEMIFSSPQRLKAEERSDELRR